MIRGMVEANTSGKISLRTLLGVVTYVCAMLAFCRADGVFDAEPGWFDAWVAPSSTAGEPVSFALVAAG